MRHLGTVSNADFCDGDSDRKSNLFPVDVLHFGGKPLFPRADVRTASFPLSTKRGYIFCFHALNIYHFFLIWFPKASKRPTQYIIGINLGFRLHIVFKYTSYLQILRRVRLRVRDFLSTKQCPRVNQRHFGGKTWQPSSLYYEFQRECRSCGNKLSNVRSFIILPSGEGATSFTKGNSASFSGEKW